MCSTELLLPQDNILSGFESAHAHRVTSLERRPRQRLQTQCEFSVRLEWPHLPV